MRTFIYAFLFGTSYSIESYRFTSYLIFMLFNQTYISDSYPIILHKQFATKCLQSTSWRYLDVGYSFTFTFSSILETKTKLIEINKL